VIAERTDNLHMVDNHDENEMRNELNANERKKYICDQEDISPIA
jgi:hypothetical protein